VLEPITTDATSPGWTGLLTLVSAIGSGQFETALSHYLDEVCGVEHVGIFRSVDDVPLPISAISADGTDVSEHHTRIYSHAELWREDPTMRRAMSCRAAAEPMVLYLNVVGAPSSKFRDALIHRMKIRERVFVCGRRHDGILGLTMWQSDRPTPLDPSRDKLVFAATQAAFSILSKHLDICGQGDGLARALTSLAEIEKCFGRSSLKLPRRESQVAARMLFGLSTTGIALDLNLSEETVITYRKRLYKRLCVFNLRGLLLWYLVLWSKTGFMLDH
jgi:DNA-binding CsgD family transcriptional regulator